jgi:hypothetical protein
MADQHTRRRAAFFRSRAEYLLREAEAEFAEERRRHLLDLADAFTREADQLSPPAAVQSRALS